MKRIIILAVGSYRSFYVALAPDLLSNGGPNGVSPPEPLIRSRREGKENRRGRELNRRCLPAYFHGNRSA
jgi:hypothetical protein